MRERRQSPSRWSRTLCSPPAWRPGRRWGRAKRCRPSSGWSELPGTGSAGREPTGKFPSHNKALRCYKRRFKEVAGDQEYRRSNLLQINKELSLDHEKNLTWHKMQKLKNKKWIQMLFEDYKVHSAQRVNCLFFPDSGDFFCRILNRNQQ